MSYVSLSVGRSPGVISSTTTSLREVIRRILRQYKVFPVNFGRQTKTCEFKATVKHLES